MAKNQISNSVRKKADKIMEQSSVMSLKRDGQLPAVRLPMDVERWYREQASKKNRRVTDLLFLWLMNNYYEQTGKREKLEY